MTGIAYAPPRQDADQDGVVRALDRCPDGAEDFDGFQDEDGCPEPDNDNDGLLDADDQCPNLPEDFDGFEDEDGCPDPDNDQDGIADADDACPMVFGVIELKGCPEEDEDGDGIPDHRDQCPDVPEDFDGFNDEDGCPDPDNDQDGIPDLQDQCPNEPETLNGFEDEDGCPDEGRSNVRLRGSRLEIGERVYFDTASDRIQERSYPILRQMAAVLKSQPDLTKIRVSGHTDARGDDAMNQDLSERRAASVMRFLIENGIEAERLTSRGFGESHPVDTNDSAKGREMNRRVEFHILEKAEK
jgi:outer membrane protein OmpA-like peptidoglycan-associated protein